MNAGYLQLRVPLALLSSKNDETGLVMVEQPEPASGSGEASEARKVDFTVDGAWTGYRSRA